jgi:hypothetical protein
MAAGGLGMWPLSGRGGLLTTGVSSELTMGVSSELFSHYHISLQTMSPKLQFRNCDWPADDDTSV